MEYPDELPRPYFSDRADDNLVSELLGLCKGIIADGEFSEAEAIALRTWIDSHPFMREKFPANILAERLELMFKNGLIEDDERRELHRMMRDLVGARKDAKDKLNESTRLPLDDPEPPIFFEGMEFVFTGHFCIPRRECERRVLDRAGRFNKDLSRRTDYLVIGTIASAAWVTTGWGTKILEALDMKAEGHGIAIVSEAHWLAAIEYGA